MTRTVSILGLVGFVCVLPAAAVAQPALGEMPASAPAAEEVEDLDDVVVHDVDSEWNPMNFPEIERIVNVPTARVTRKFAFLFVVDHRASEAIRNNPFQDFFGFDGGNLKIGLGLRFGVWDDLDVGVYRLSRGSDPFTVWELDARWRFLQQEKYVLDMTARAGGTWFQQAPVSDSAGGGFAQLAITRSFFNERLVLSTGLFYHSSSSSDAKSDLDKAWSLAIPAGIEGRPLTWLAFDFEVVGAVAGYRAAYPGISGAVKFVTNRHTFSIIVANTQYISADGIAGSDRGIRDVLIGFNITREFHL